jgi:hypothetical protein
MTEWDISRAAREIDADTLARAAREALGRPSDTGVWDDRLWRTHGLVISWADRGDDTLAESNYLMVRDALEGTCAHNGREDEGDIIDASMSHWLVGSMRELFVRVYVPGDDDEPTDEYTPAFREATVIALFLRDDYPVFDDSDYSEREWRDFEAALDDALAHAMTNVDYIDTLSECEAIVSLAREAIGDTSNWCCADDVSWADVETYYGDARTAYYVARARERFDLTDTMTPLI